MAQLVQHRAHPVLVGYDVNKHTDITIGVDVGGEGMWGFAFLLVKVSAIENVFDRQADARIELSANLKNVGLFEGLVDVGGEHGRAVLEKRIVVVPGAKIRDVDTALFGQTGINVGLGG